MIDRYKLFYKDEVGDDNRYNPTIQWHNKK
jgi:hypothetical protein